MVSTLSSPWPGPRPFTGDETSLLECRDKELAAFGSLFRKAKQVIQLSAKSGVGKTSFLRAKLLPTLNKAGYITLLHRNWAPAGIVQHGLGGGQDLYRYAIDAAISDYQDKSGEYLGPARDADVVDRLRSIVSNAPHKRGVLFVFDQFEELLRRDPRLGRGFLDEVIRVAREAPVKQILSLRSEYAEELLPIHRALGFSAEALRLEELDVNQLRSVITKPPLHFQITVTRKASEEILSWWTTARDRQFSSGDTYREGSEVSALGVDDVGLLHLQGVLWALYQDWLEHGEDKHRIGLRDVWGFKFRLAGAALADDTEGTYQLDLDDFDDTDDTDEADDTDDTDDTDDDGDSGNDSGDESDMKDTAVTAAPIRIRTDVAAPDGAGAREIGAMDGTTGVRILTQSLRQWIERAVAIDATNVAEVRLLNLASDLTVALTDQLSAGGYKITAELTQLATTCIGDALLRLGMEATSIERATRACLDALGDPERGTPTEYVPVLEHAAVSLDELLVLAREPIVSGRIAGHVYREYRVAKVELLTSELSPEELEHAVRELNAGALRHAARQLIGAFAVAIFRLQAAQILKEPPSIGEIRLFEIVHDGFGPTLRSWSASQHVKPRAAVESVVAITGDDLTWDQFTGGDLIDGVADGVCWTGCWISSLKGQDATISGVTFIDSDFTGSAFENLAFSGVTFKKCRLRGVLFRNCVFNDVTFSDGDMSHTTFDTVTVTTVNLTKVDGNCVSFTDLVSGIWNFEEASLRQVLFDKSESVGMSEVVVNVKNSPLAHWQFDAAAVAELNVSGSAIMFLTTDPSEREGWIRLTDCEQIGSMLPGGALVVPPRDLNDNGGPTLTQDRQPFQRQPTRDDGRVIDPWMAGRPVRG